MRIFHTLIMLFFICPLFSQGDSLVLNYNEYLAIVKKYHPLVKQANLVIDEGDFKLMKARGAFDPKLEADYSGKEFKGTEYYSLFNSAFKVPTYFGLGFKASFEDNTGTYLNPQNTVPENGLYSAGVELDVTNGIFLSERMAALKQAKIYRDQSRVKRDLFVAEAIYEASLAYFNWYSAWQELELYENLVENAAFRLSAVKKEFRAGDKPAVDTLEANITFDNRQLQLQQAELDYLKASLKLSNYLWAENNLPLEITEAVVPEENLFEAVNEILLANEFSESNTVSNNPKVRVLRYDLEMLEVEKNLMANRLLPDVELSYNFLTSDAEQWQRINSDDYKFGLKFSLPIFMRKERGAYNLAKIQLENSQYDLDFFSRQLENELSILKNEINSYKDQRFKMNALVYDYAKLVSAEQRKFELGDSSLFLVNNRENSYISAKLKEIEILFKFLKSHAELQKLTASF